MKTPEKSYVSLATSLSFKIIFIFLLLKLPVFAQTTNVVWEPETKINISTESRWSFNFNISHRNITNNNLDSNIEGNHVDFSHFSNYQSGFYSKLSLGLRYRNRDWIEPEKSNEFRITQQYNHSRGFDKIRLGHRIRFEQRFYDTQTEFRPRYRLNLQTPLQGLSLDTGEFYAVFSTEALYTISTQSAPSLDQRFASGLGYEVSSTLKLEISTEYRLEGYLNDPGGQVFGFTSAIIDL